MRKTTEGGKTSRGYLLAVFFLAFSFFAYAFFSGKYPSSRNPVDIARIGGQDHYLEKVDSDAKRRLGLGNRKELCEKCGMLFVFLEEKEHVFWMKDMLFPLDIIWLKDGKIVLIEKNISQTSSETFGKGVISDSVIELNAGISDKLGIKEGDIVSF